MRIPSVIALLVAVVAAVEVSAQSTETTREIPELTDRLCDAIERKGIPYRKGTSWTTDAPYRETVEKVQRHCSDGVATVEMEASALFAVGAYRGVGVGSVFAISDTLSEGAWNQGYHDEEKLEYYGECCHGKSESKRV